MTDLVATIARNIQCREYALEVVEMCGEQPPRFWEALREFAAEKLPPPPQPVERFPAMNDAQALAFEAEIMPYGKWQGLSVGVTDCDYLLFLTEGDQFSQRLKRYVKSKRFLDRQENE